MTIAFYFLLFFGIALLFYAGSYDYGADIRYSLATYPPLAILGGLGLARLVRLGRSVSSLGLPALPVTDGGCVVAQFLWWYLAGRACNHRRRVGGACGRAIRAVAGARPVGETPTC